MSSAIDIPHPHPPTVPAILTVEWDATDEWAAMILCIHGKTRFVGYLHLGAEFVLRRFTDRHERAPQRFAIDATVSTAITEEAL